MEKASSHRDLSHALGLGTIPWRVISPWISDSQIHDQYREWRIATAIPFARIGYMGSLVSWAVLLLAITLLSPDSVSIAGPAISIWLFLMLLLVASTFWSVAQRWTMPLAAFANFIGGILVAWLLFDVVSTFLITEVRAGLMSGGVVIVMFFGFAVFRIPPWLGVLSITPYLLFSLFNLHASFSVGSLSTIVAGSFAAMLLIAYIGGVLVSIVIEMANRRAFIKDQIIQSQQKALEDSRDAIRRYIPPAVAEHIIKGETESIEKPVRQRVTMLFCDIVEFTEIVDRVEPEVMTHVLNEYLSAMSELLDSHGGTLNELAGNRFMALFGAPERMPPAQTARLSVEAALAMQSKMPELNEAWRIFGLSDDLQIRIGINTGMASVGSYGSQGRMTYTAAGRETNIASRIEGAANPGSIWISGATYLLVQDEFEFESRGEVDYKSLDIAIPVFEVVK